MTRGNQKDPRMGEGNVLMDQHTVLEHVSTAFRRQLIMEALEVHEREGTIKGRLARKLWSLLSYIDGTDYVSQLEDE